MFPLLARLFGLLALVLLLPLSALAQAPVLPRFLAEVPPATLVDGADAYGAMRSDVPVAPLLRNGERIGWVFITSDFVGTTGYSGKPIHIMIALDDAARVLGINLVHHSEPIVLIGIPESRIQALMAQHVGLNLAEVAANGGTMPDFNIISGATVTIMVIDDSIVRSGIRVARRLGLGGLAPQEAPTGPRFEINTAATAPESWSALVGDGTVRRMTLEVAEVNAAFERLDDPRAVRSPSPMMPSILTFTRRKSACRGSASSFWERLSIATLPTG